MIQKPITTANGPAAFHVLKKVESIPPFTALTLTVDSYADEATYLAAGSYMLRNMVVMPEPSTIASQAESWLTTDVASPFAGGQIVADQSDTLDAAKSRAWAAVKGARAAAEQGGFTYDGNLYDIDNAHVTGAVVLALIAKSAGAPYSETWTLFDDTTRDLDADQVIALGVALGQRVSEIYSTARTLRDQIAAADSIEAVNAIHWPQ